MYALVDLNGTKHNHAYYAHHPQRYGYSINLKRCNQYVSVVPKAALIDHLPTLCWPSHRPCHQILPASVQRCSPRLSQDQSLSPNIL